MKLATIKHLGILGLSLLLSACASPKIKTTKQITPDDAGTVAVLPFSGINGSQFSDAVTQELIMNNVRVVERSRVMAILSEQGLSMSQISEGGGNYSQLGGLLGVDSLVLGSVSPIMVYESGAPSGKVSTASIRIVSVKNGTILAATSYNANTELLRGSVLYPKAAEKMIKSLFQ
jgi:curli biogenesis system outer membrane secretion channel CsgG